MADAAPAAGELNELRERYNSASIRASTAKDGLAAIEAQMSRQGLGLRADIREARTRADYQLQEAMSSLRGGDVEAAKQNLRYAENAIQTLEKFLGR
jgi:septation ring formation regulator EzrA